MGKRGIDERAESLKRIRNEREGNVATRLALCTEHLSRFPDHGPVWLDLANVCMELGLYRKAENAIDSAEKYAPKTKKHLVYWYRAWLDEFRCDYPNAMRWIRKAAKLKPDDASSWIYAGGVAFKQGRIKLWEKYSRRALECSEGCLDEAWFSLGGALLAQGKLTEARDCYLKAIEIDPNYREAKERLRDVEKALRFRSKKEARIRKS